MNYLNEFNCRSTREQFDYFINLCNDPKKVQETVLLDILEKNKSCKIGEDYNFNSIKDSADFQEKIPVSHWSDYDE
jgi:hypothetical protein